MASDTIEIRAAVCRGFGEPLAIETLLLAPPEGSEIRVRVRASSICHSDITYMDGGWGGEDVLPAVFGHELAGTVTDLGPSVPPDGIRSRSPAPIGSRTGRGRSRRRSIST